MMRRFEATMRNILRATAFFMLFALLFVTASRAFTPDLNTAEDGMESRISKAYRGEEKNSLDVIFIGNSDIYRGISPVDLYHATGITSAVAGRPKKSLEEIPGDIRDILKYQKPKILVLETDCMFSSANPQFTKSAGIRRSLLKKIKSVVEEGDSAIVTAINFYFPLIKYHNNWRNINLSSLFHHPRRYYKFSNKGMAYSDQVKPFDPKIDYMNSGSGKTAALSDTEKEIFDRICTLCRENQVRLVLLTVPSANTWNNAKSHAVQMLAEQYGLSYYDYNVTYPEAFDWKTDTKDGGNHLNYRGALKLTKDFGCKLQKDLELKATKLSDDQIEQWEKDYRYFHDKIAGK